MLGELFQLLILGLIVGGAIFIARTVAASNADDQAEAIADTERRTWFQEQGWRYGSRHGRGRFQWSATAELAGLGESRLEFEFVRRARSHAPPRIAFHAPRPTTTPVAVLFAHRDEVERLRGTAARLFESVTRAIGDDDAAAEDAAFRHLLERGSEYPSAQQPEFVWLATRNEHAATVAATAPLDAALSTLLDSLDHYYVSGAWRDRQFSLRCSSAGGYRFDAVAPTFRVEHAQTLMAIMTAFESRVSTLQR